MDLLAIATAIVAHAERHFAKVTPDAWWIEEVRTVEYHDPATEFQRVEEERQSIRNTNPTPDHG